MKTLTYCDDFYFGKADKYSIDRDCFGEIYIKLLKYVYTEKKDMTRIYKRRSIMHFMSDKDAKKFADDILKIINEKDSLK